jgi:CheY-like chemotaxis protein
VGLGLLRGASRLLEDLPVSLNGNLEDLPLLDILQIVSFSKKTGYLAIQTEAGDGAIVFRDGLVVASFTWDGLPMDARVATLPDDKRDALIRNRIGAALEQLIRLREGQFSFNLTDETPGAIAGRDISLETLPAGINPQELLLDLARGIDEDRRDSSAALEASFAEPEAAVDVVQVEAEPDSPEPEAAAQDGAMEEEDLLSLEPLADEAEAALTPEDPLAHQQRLPDPEAAASPRDEPASSPPRTILLVDDEEDVRRILATLFTQVGYEVFQADEPSAAVKQAQALGKAGRSFLLITDLGMPTSGGASFQGGFEVVKRLWKMNLRPPILMMTDSLSPALQARARQMGVSSFVFKPSLSKLDSKQFEADMKAFAGKMIQDVVPRLGRVAPGVRKARATAPAPAPRVEPPASVEDLSRDFSMLQQRLVELRSHGDATQISSLVMRVAREFFERGMLFLVKNDEVRGLGGFGRAPKDSNISFLAREIVIPLAEASVFRDVVTRRRPFIGPLPEGKWSRHLEGRIGKFQSAEVALLPLLTHREAVAVLFGDNPETGRALARLEGLEVFINQAGIALENAFLQRKLQTLQPQA